MPASRAVAALLVVLVLAGSAAAQSRRPPVAKAAATLSILNGSAQHVPAAGGAARAATDGMDLAVGDRVVTGRTARALVTFLDGSTLTLEPGSDVTIKRMEQARGTSNVGVHINVGTVWARVARLADPGSRLALESNTATASVHDGLIGGEARRDGTFLCWTQAGTMTVTDAQGRSLIALEPGQMTTVRPGAPPAPAPFTVAFSTLRVTTSDNVAPLLQGPDGPAVAGFVAPGIEVNQIYGSRTAVEADTRLVEIPAGSRGPFWVVIEAIREGPYRVVVEGRYLGSPTYRHELTGTIAAGERLGSGVSQQLPDVEGLSPATDYRTARVERAQVAPFRPTRGDLPGRILLSPAELEAASR